jgi:hypothetical protein
MKRQDKNIIALAIILIPFYFVAILQKVLFTKDQILVEEYLGYYMLLGIIGISSILLTNKYFLNNKITVFREAESKIVLEISLAGFILSIFYLLKSIEVISYGNWFYKEVNNPDTDELFLKIFDNTLYSILIIGPFVWLNEAFIALSIGFILINLWLLNHKKIWVWTSIMITGSIFAIVQINLGVPEMINSFIIIIVSGYIFYKYRSIIPFLLASIIHQTIDLGNFWYYTQ